jgi:hypothetical protein
MKGGQFRFLGNSRTPPRPIMLPRAGDETPVRSGCSPGRLRFPRGRPPVGLSLIGELSLEPNTGPLRGPGGIWRPWNVTV